MRITGSADLPLHGGHVPPWMLRVMTRLAKAIVAYIVEVRGVEAVMGMLSDPLWFQAFNNVIGMDWDSSGSTTVVMGILKSISWREDLGFLVLGGKGSRMRSVPEEAVEASRRLDVDQGIIERFSRASARIDSSLLQDGYDLYHHAVVVSDKSLLVVQQGMNTEKSMARRYHIISNDLNKPHSGIAGVRDRATLLNALGPENEKARRAYIELLQEPASRIERLLREANARIGSSEGRVGLERWFQLHMRPGETQPPSGGEESRRPYYKPILPSPSLMRSLERLVSWGVASEEDLLYAPGLGPSTLRALALIADIIYGVPTGVDDPVTHPLGPFVYAYAVGGKDGIPYLFNARVAIEAYRFLEEALEEARLDKRDKERALRRLRERLRVFSEPGSRGV